MPTKKTEPTLEERIDDARAELAATNRRMGELSEELSAIPGRIEGVGWSDEEKAMLEIAALERRRGGLPHLLHHLRRQAIEQELAVYDLEEEEAEGHRPELEARVAECEEAHQGARDALNRARGSLNELVYGQLSDIRRNRSEAQKRLRALGKEPAPAERGPVVRSSWQRTQGSPGPENYLQVGAGAGITPEFAPGHEPGEAAADRAEDRQGFAGEGKGQKAG